MRRRRSPQRWNARNQWLAVTLVVIAASAVFWERTARGDSWTVAAELFGLPVGATAALVPNAPSVDAAALAEPAVLSDAAADVADRGRLERLRNRYVEWSSAREPVAYLDTYPALPSEAGFPPLPDAPDGEITRAREALAAEVLQ